MDDQQILIDLQCRLEFDDLVFGYADLGERCADGR